MEEKGLIKKDILKTVGDNKKRDRRPKPPTIYLLLIPLALALLVALAISGTFSQLAMTIVICITVLAFTVICGTLFLTILTPPAKDPLDEPLFKSVEQERGEWMVEQSLRIANGLKTRTTERTLPDGSVQRVTEGLTETERQQLMGLLTKALDKAQSVELPPLSLDELPKEADIESEKLELDNRLNDEDFIV